MENELRRPIMQYLVVGSPIEHSRSPLIHRLFAEQFGLPLRYDKREVKAGELAQALGEFWRAGVAGINVTVPLKEEAYSLAGEMTERAREAGAVNTLMLSARGELLGDNTDGAGLVRDLIANQVGISQTRILVLGAGGAARGIVPAILRERPLQLTVANRTPEKANLLCARFGAIGALESSPSDASYERPFDLIVNATSGGLTSSPFDVSISATAIGPETVCYDLVYGRAETPFLAWARCNGAGRGLDGLGMLVEQASIAFRWWHDLNPETASVISYVRALSRQ